MLWNIALAKRLFGKATTNISFKSNNINNIYPQTPPSNEGSVYGGTKSLDNQTYYECMLDSEVSLHGEAYFYRAKLVYGKDETEIVPRGIRLQAIQVIKSDESLVLSENTLFNVFVPNITKFSLIDYKNANKLTVCE